MKILIKKINFREPKILKQRFGLIILENPDTKKVNLKH